MKLKKLFPFVFSLVPLSLFVVPITTSCDFFKLNADADDNTPPPASELFNISNNVLNNLTDIGVQQTELTIPKSVISIGSGALQNSINLKTVTFEKGSQLISIEDHAFYNCSLLTSIALPSSINQIGNDAFNGCQSLSTIDLSQSNLKQIQANTFYSCVALSSVIFPKNVTSIGESAFWNCSSLTSITIPNSVNLIASITFQGCSSLTSITIDNPNISIGSYAFDGCLSNAKYYVPNEQVKQLLLNSHSGIQESQIILPSEPSQPSDPGKQPSDPTKPVEPINPGDTGKPSDLSKLNDLNE